MKLWKSSELDEIREFAEIRRLDVSCTNRRNVFMFRLCPLPPNSCESTNRWKCGVDDSTKKKNETDFQ